MAADWQAIKTEYITTITSYRKLAEKYGIKYTVIGERAKAEGWVDARKQYRDDTVTKTVEAIAQKEVDRAARVRTVADKLLDKIEAMVDAAEPTEMTAKAIRSLTAAVKDLREIQGIKSDLDAMEQEARIAKLRKESASEEERNDAPKLVVEGLPEEFKV